MAARPPDRATPHLTRVLSRSVDLAEPDLSKLRIERSSQHASKGVRRPRRLLRSAAVAIALLAGAALAIFYRPVQQVDLGTAAQLYPTQAVTVLNSTGYVV